MRDLSRCPYHDWIKKRHGRAQPAADFLEGMSGCLLANLMGLITASLISFDEVPGKGTGLNFRQQLPSIAARVSFATIRVTLYAIADDGNLFLLDHGEICIVIVIGFRHLPSFLPG